MTPRDILPWLKSYPVPAISGLVVIVCLLNHYFRGGALADLEMRLDEVSRQATQVDTNLVTGASLAENLDQMRGLVGQLEERIIRQAELPTNKKYFYELEARTGAGLADLQQNPAAPLPKGSSKAFVPVPYSVTLTGTFAQIVAYLEELEKGKHFCRINNLNAQRGREGSRGSVTLAVNLELLGWP